jgi:hypothetical protein
LLVSYEKLNGFRIWWRHTLMQGWRDGNLDRIPAQPPTETYDGLQIWPHDPKWAGFQVDLGYEVAEGTMDNILSNLSIEWYAWLSVALRHG